MLLRLIRNELRRFFRSSARRAIRSKTKSYIVMAVALPVLMALFSIFLAWMRGKYGFIT